jgi:hypothetical protein
LKFVGQRVVHYGGNKDNLDLRGCMGAFVGYDESNYGYRICSKEIGNVMMTCDVRFLNEVCDGGFDLEDD